MARIHGALGLRSSKSTARLTGLGLASGMLAEALVAVAIPAWRAVRIEPLEVVRGD